MDELIVVYLIATIVYILLAFIPASIAEGKGKSKGAWWFYGFMLFPIALIHSLLLKDERAEQEKKTQDVLLHAPDALLKYKSLLEEGLITQEQYDEKKNALLQQMREAERTRQELEIEIVREEVFETTDPNTLNLKCPNCGNFMGVRKGIEQYYYCPFCRQRIHYSGNH